LAIVATLALPASAGVCPGASGLLNAVTDMAPDCFNKCVQLCGPLENMVTQYMATQDVESVKKQVCDQQDAFSCFFREDSVKSCAPVMQAATTFGIALPTDMGDLHRQCAALGEGGANMNMDMPGGNETEGNETKSTTRTVLSSGSVTAAAAPLLLLACSAGAVHL